MGGVVASLAPHFHGEEALRKKSWVFSKLCLFKNAQSQLGPAPPSTPTSRVVPASSGSGRDPYALDAPSVEVPSLVTSCFLPWVPALQQYHQPAPYCSFSRTLATSEGAGRLLGLGGPAPADQASGPASQS